jgi:hypothetical protein
MFTACVQQLAESEAPGTDVEWELRYAHVSGNAARSDAVADFDP